MFFYRLFIEFDRDRLFQATNVLCIDSRAKHTANSVGKTLLRTAIFERDFCSVFLRVRDNVSAITSSDHVNRFMTERYRNSAVFKSRVVKLQLIFVHLVDRFNYFTQLCIIEYENLMSCTRCIFRSLSQFGELARGFV